MEPEYKDFDIGIHTTIFERIKLCERLQSSVYGSITELGDERFPIPLGKSEASLNLKNHQRRYLWTDAFGIINFVSLALMYRKIRDISKEEENLRSASRLIDVVFQTLGNPTSSLYPMALNTQHKSKGLRIGKLNQSHISDAGM